MAVIINEAVLGSVLHQAKNQPTRLFCNLMVEMLTIDELRCSTLRGKRHSPALDQDIMNAILCKNMNTLISVIIHMYT